MLQKLKTNRSQSGFTIIEVLIVLAIAGLIMVVVFLAVPGLEKSQRNNARDTDANNLLESVGQYEGNSGGTMPTDASCTSATACAWITYKPNQLTTYKVLTTTAAGGTDAIPASTSFAPNNNTAYLIIGAICAPNASTTTPIQPSSTASGVSARRYGIEGSTAAKCTQGS
jgi:prepilin-type N-terminal cleavage/methylation domain-containing protein